MIKSVFIVISVITVFVVSVFLTPDQNVVVTQQAPTEIEAGKEAVIELTINKGNIDGYARLQQHLPLGFKAEPISIGNAQFTFEDQFIMIAWLTLPCEPVFNVAYKITADENFHGDQSLGGIFSYIEKDKTKTIDITPVTLRSIDRSAATADAIEINRVIPNKFAANKPFLVELSVTNKSIHGIGKLVEHLPIGWTATAMETSGGLFKMQDSLAKFIWLNMPKDSVFKVSYMLIPGKNVKEVKSIYGTFAFEDNGTPRSFDYYPYPVTKQKDAIALAIKESLEPKPKSQEALLAMATGIPSPEIGITYKIQVAASRKFIEEASLSSRYHLNEEVIPEMNDGWNKYLIGSYTEYRTAREKRLNTSQKVSGAFVVAYNNGRRIPVREALQASGQKWAQ